MNKKTASIRPVAQPQPDIAIQGYGSFTVIKPLTPRATQTMLDVLDTAPAQWCEDGALIIEADCLPEVIEALRPWLTVESRGGSGYVPRTVTR